MPRNAQLKDLKSGHFDESLIRAVAANNKLDKLQSLKNKVLTLDDVYKFHKETLAGQHYTYCVIASDKRINPDELKKYGALQTLSVSELFGF